jgi:hypothetical protein
MRPVFFKLTLWNDPQKGAKRPAEWGACRAANREGHQRTDRAERSRPTTAEHDLDWR